jgi:hypothetical protein
MTVDEKFPWVKHTGARGGYTAEASLLEYNHQSSCPVCGLEVFRQRALPTKPRELGAIFDTDGDIQCWEGKCSCGTDLIIFND